MQIEPWSRKRPSTDPSRDTIPRYKRGQQTKRAVIFGATRIHGTTKRQVAAMFAEEKPLLQPLPIEPFRYYQHGQRVVHLDGCVEVEAAYYGLPLGWIGRMVRVQWNQIFVQQNFPIRLIKSSDHNKSCGVHRATFALCAAILRSFRTQSAEQLNYPVFGLDPMESWKGITDFLTSATFGFALNLAAGLSAASFEREFSSERRQCAETRNDFVPGPGSAQM